MCVTVINVSNLTSDTERRVFYVDVGNISIFKIKSILKDIMNREVVQLNRRRQYNENIMK